MKFHDRGYSDILFGINSIDVILYSRIHMVHNHMVIPCDFTKYHMVSFMIEDSDILYGINSVDIM